MAGWLGVWLQWLIGSVTGYVAGAMRLADCVALWLYSWMPAKLFGLLGLYGWAESAIII